MALGFIKKVFTFGKKSEEASDKQDAVPHIEAAEETAAEADRAAGDISLAEAEALADWDGGLPDPEPEPGVSDETAQEFAAEHAAEPEPPHVTEISLDEAEDLADWDADLPEPAPEPATADIQHDRPDSDDLSAEEAEKLADWDANTADPEPLAGVSDEPAPAEEPAAPVQHQVPEISVEEAEELSEWDADLGSPMPEPDDASDLLAVKETVLPKGFSTAKETAATPEVAAPAPRLSWFQRLRAGLARTSSQLTGQITALFTKRKLDEDTLEELEDLLIQADLGVETALRVTDTLSSERYGRDVSGEEVVAIMAREIEKVLTPVAKPLALDLNHKPHVILVVGVNGTGKTTTIGKLAAKLSGAGLKVMLAAGDTFRAAAIEQLKIWADRTGSEFIGTTLGADAAGLAFDAFKQAKEKGSDVLIIDTAGRLQNKAELMAELEKIVRVLGKLDPDAPHTVLQTLDATTGQNALQQVEIFRNVAGVSGLVMTKLDGTARGGILVAIAAKHKLPVYFIGVGEGVDDLEPFEAGEFAKAVAGLH
ncbi:signal recognition particle-docking protein FtsY [Rhizobium sp. L1K21]|uniref:signal recognition particle-docking protein FtsY n=1 Tax=Rhizobium sp. L1K21 TaxID=2954933 RepID=UPI002091F297|nr:signal recognition particle-docking protein FtsY [Rhizobium sp. L1K21]MCO6188081.1 signal recognition particle-docking protein FtsY [Rhizobium sp. L1K21]